MTEDSILGYDLYSSALAEILSEPSLHTPITVGLYAKWGSGKSFLLLQLKNEMKSFAKLSQTIDLRMNLSFVSILVLLVLMFTLPFFFWNAIYGAVVFVSICLVSFVTICTIKYSSSSFFRLFQFLNVPFLLNLIVVSKWIYDHQSREWAERFCKRIADQILNIKLLLRILFLNPGNYLNYNPEHRNLRLY